MLQFYAYQLSIRSRVRSIRFPIHYEDELFQHYLVDTYVKVLSTRLDYMQKNQDRLRRDQYHGLMDHLNNRADALLGAPANIQIGVPVVFPSSFQGGP